MTKRYFLSLSRIKILFIKLARNDIFLQCLDVVMVTIKRRPGAQGTWRRGNLLNRRTIQRGRREVSGEIITRRRKEDNFYQGTIQAPPFQSLLSRISCPFFVLFTPLYIVVQSLVFCGMKSFAVCHMRLTCQGVNLRPTPSCTVLSNHQGFWIPYESNSILADTERIRDPLIIFARLDSSLLGYKS